MDQLLLYDTLNTINASLNKRFEKDADLYISKQDEYELKKHFCHAEYPAAIDMMKGHDISPDIILKVLIRCAGAMPISSSRDIKVLEREMDTVFETVNYRAINYLIDDILSDSVYVQEELKNFIFKKFVEGTKGGYIHNHIWPEYKDTMNENNRRVAFMSILTTAKAKDPSKTGLVRWRFLINAVKEYPSLLKDEQLIIKLKESLDEADQNKLFGTLAKQMETPDVEDDSYISMVLYAYRSYGQKAFDYSLPRLRDRQQKNLKGFTKAVIYIFENENEVNAAKTMFIKLSNIAEDTTAPRMTTNILNDKLWVRAQKKEYIYEQYKSKIDRYVSQRDKDSKKNYTSFSDVAMDLKFAIEDREIMQVAYNWINMSGETFKESLIDSFQSSTDAYMLGQAYKDLFVHSQKMSAAKLTQTCTYAAEAYLDYVYTETMTSTASDYFDYYLLEYVLKYKLNTNKSIIKYVHDVHFEELAAFTK